MERMKSTDRLGIGRQNVNNKRKSTIFLTGKAWINWKNHFFERLVRKTHKRMDFWLPHGLLLLYICKRGGTIASQFLFPFMG